MIEPPPPATSVVDSAINLFADLLPLQDLSSVTRTVTQLLESVWSPKLEKNVGSEVSSTSQCCNRPCSYTAISYNVAFS